MNAPLRHAFFFGEYNLSIDDKSRLTIPVDVRACIDAFRDGEDFFVTFGVNRKPWVYPERYYKTLATQAPTDMAPEDDLLAYDQMMFALAKQVSLDKQFRIPLHEALLRRTGTAKEVTLTGVRDHLEIWNRADWEARFDTLMEQSSDVVARAKRMRKQIAAEQQQQGYSR
jgi:MraZ protein